MEDAVVPNDENNDEDSLASDIDPPPQTILWKLKECTEWEIKLKKGKLKEGTMKLKEWTQKIKEWKKKSYLLKEKGIP